MIFKDQATGKEYNTESNDSLEAMQARKLQYLQKQNMQPTLTNYDPSGQVAPPPPPPVQMTPPPPAMNLDPDKLQNVEDSFAGKQSAAQLEALKRLRGY